MPLLFKGLGYDAGMNKPARLASVLCGVCAKRPHQLRLHWNRNVKVIWHEVARIFANYILPQVFDRFRQDAITAIYSAQVGVAMAVLHDVLSECGTILVSTTGGGFETEPATQKPEVLLCLLAQWYPLPFFW